MKKQRFLKKLLRKTFYIELDDSLHYPSPKTICSAVETYEEKLRFESKTKPITFYLEDTLYSTDVRMARGGYYIFCREV
ncbi:hypothetical protein COK47_31645 [Bacillus cereus]|nr:hypothetical protein CN462_30830 [Bacillus cereus]PFS25077.1 hypothetical protein COK47_31645 [Bacillus cereus]